MTIKAIEVLNPSEPIEVQSWLDSNLSVTIIDVVYDKQVFYIFYE
jgi:hypothetical protein